MLPFKEKVNTARLSRVEVWFLLVLLLCGLPMIVLIPPGAGYDEEDHLVRVWELSAGSFIPGQLSPRQLQYPTVFRDFAYRQQGSAGVVDAAFWQSYARAPLYERGFVRRELDTKSVYSPALLLPQALAMRLFGRWAGLPTLPAFYISRLAGLLSYLALAWLAIRALPSGKWLLLVLAASPMALFQAATITPDAISNGIGFLFVAGSLKLAKSEAIGWRELGSLLILVFLLFLAKLNLVPLILLVLLLIPPWRFPDKRIYVLLLTAIVVLFLVEAAGWNWIVSTNVDSMLANDANLTAQLLHIAAHPFEFLQIILQDVAENTGAYFLGWINGYGYYYWTPPAIVSVLFVLSLAAALLSDPGNWSRTSRLIFLLVVAAGYLAAVLSLYTSFNPVGSDRILGIQGRYFVPLALPLFLAVSGFSWKGKPGPSWRWVVIFLIAALFLNLLGLFLAFHAPCGATFYQNSLCYRPLFRDFPSSARASEPVAEGMLLTQEIGVACDGLAELRVLLIPSGAGDQGTTRFVLRDSANGNPLLDASLPNEQIRAENWYPLRFEPDWRSAGKQYVLEISGVSPPGEGPQVLYSPQSEFDLGSSFMNGQLLEEDLVLQYGCVTGLRKLWLIGRP